jgi:hypothetical protein
MFDYDTLFANNKHYCWISNRGYHSEDKGLKKEEETEDTHMHEQESG